VDTTATIISIEDIPTSIFQEERRLPKRGAGSGGLVYQLPAPHAGTYKVAFYFAEISRNSTGRFFDVSINGMLVLDNYDIFANVGFGTATKEEYTLTTATAGNITIDFQRVARDPKVNAILLEEVLPSVDEGVWDSIYRVNCGADEPQYDDDGALWVPDSGLFASTPPITQLAPRAESDQVSPIYRSNRVFDSTYAYTLPLESIYIYRVTLHHVEWSRKGQKRNKPNMYSIFVNNHSLFETPNLIEDNGVPATSRVTIHAANQLTIAVVPLENNGLLAAFEVEQHVGPTPSSSFALPAAYPPRPTWVPIYRINCGGDDYVSDSEFGWSKDTSGKLGTPVATQQNTETSLLPDVPLYITGLESSSTRRNMRYKLPIPVRTRLNVTATFIETDPSMQGPGSRVFGIKLEDRVVASNFDIAAQVGFEQPIQRSYIAMSRNKHANIVFQRQTSSPKINALQVATRIQRPPVVGEQRYSIVYGGSLTHWPVFFFDANPDVVTVRMTAHPAVTLSNGFLEVDGHRFTTSASVDITVNDGRTARTKRYYFHKVESDWMLNWTEYSLDKPTGSMMAVQSNNLVLIDVQTGDISVASPNIAAQNIKTQLTAARSQTSLEGSTAVSLDDEVYLFGGAASSQAVHKLVSNSRVGRWRMESNITEMPWSAKGACGVNVGGFAYVCGGFQDNTAVSYCGKLSLRGPLCLSLLT
jgi:hypothetical protein